MPYWEVGVHSITLEESMDAWQTVLLAFGGNAALLAVLGLLGKSLLEKMIVRDTKQFESELKSKTDAEIERLRNELARSVESYKVQLKKSEFLFQKEFEASTEFSSKLRSFHPGFNNPMMDWYEACDAIAQRFGTIELQLGAYLSKYSAALTDDERKILTNAISEAGYGKFDTTDGQVDIETNRKAGELYETLQSLDKQLIGRVRGQSSL
jgi:hypothetical protein